jgi:beta-lactamase class A
LLSLTTNVYFILANQDSKKVGLPIATEGSQYSFLSPRIFSENQNNLIVNFVSLRKHMQQLSSQLSYKTSVYFEYLPTGASIGINEKNAFVPASLLKTPLAMGIYKHYESGELKPSDTIIMDDVSRDRGFGKLWKLKSGTIITVEQALNHLIRESDNTAQKLLLKKISTEEIDKVFDALDIPKVRDGDGEAVVTAKNYSSILRCLYLSCYLSKSNSNQLLQQLSQTEFNDKLPATIPSSIPVAHKIGEHPSMRNPEKSTFTDCGIIYVPKRPYILCVMVEADESTSTSTIASYSKIAFDYVQSYQ